LIAKRFIVIILFLCPFGIEKRLWAQSFLYPGITPTTSAGMSQTGTQGAEATFWNPANILDEGPDEDEVKQAPAPELKNNQKIKMKRPKKQKHFRPYGDVSLMTVNYSYTRAGFDSTRINVTAPPVNFGLTWQPQPKWALGFLLTPRPSLQAQQIENLPYEQSGKILLVNAEQKSSVIISAIGGSFKASPKATLGFSLIETAEDISFSAIPADDASGIPLLQSASKVSVFQFLLGLRYQLNKENLIAASFKTSATKRYAGSVSVSGSTPDGTEKSDYMPSVFALGYERQFDDKSLYTEIKREGWAAGKSQFHSESPTGAKSKDYRDVLSFGLGGRMHLFKNFQGGLAFASVPNNVGSGSQLDEQGSPVGGGDLVAGTEFGNFDALDRQIFSASLRQVQKNSSITGGFNLHTGQRSVSTSAQGAGKYTLNVITLAIGASKSF
jgi:hypothetical protein